MNMELEYLIEKLRITKNPKSCIRLMNFIKTIKIADYITNKN